ncbi:28478_t:CDS:2, partial [Gigaspora margarita]
IPKLQKQKHDPLALPIPHYKNNTKGKAAKLVQTDSRSSTGNDQTRGSGKKQKFNPKRIEIVMEPQIANIIEKIKSNLWKLKQLTFQLKTHKRYVDNIEREGI